MDKPLILSPNEGDEYYFEEGCYILEYANSEADPGLSIARARVTANTETKLHKLKATIERYVILEGTGEVTLGDNPQQQVSSVKAGDVVVIPQNCPQAIRNTGTEDLVFLVLCTPRFQVENYSEC